DNRFIATVARRGYQFVAPVREESASGGGQRQSIAVMPLDNLSADPEQQYFADGMTDELIAHISRIAGIRVASRTSSMAYRQSDRPLAAIASELGVDLIVEGSVLRANDLVRITVRLIDAADDRQVWSDTFERRFEDVLKLQSDIARSVSREIAVTLSDSEQQILDAASGVDPRAYDACLKGLEHYYKLSPPDLEQALRYFQHALELDPGYARAFAGIATVWIGRQQMGFTPPRTATPLAKEAALRAVELDPLLPEARFVLSEVKAFGEFDFEAAEEHLLKAIELNPSYAEAYAIYSHELICMARLDEANEQILTALRHDPLNPFFKAFYGVVLSFRGEFEAAVEQFELALELSPGLPFALQLLSNCLHHLGRYDEALRHQRAMMAALDNTEALAAIDAGEAAGGYTEAMRRLADVTAKQAEQADNGAVFVAFRYAHAGDIDRMTDWFFKAIEQRDPNVPYIRSRFPEMAPIADDDRYRALIEQLDAARLGIFHQV
ncbi:MAG: hypothetical protein R3305_02050, partial [Gammaproteobacteria bacterium]|nr:hypothetical protein [Gammaproteobacteria bacterium]